MAGGNGVAPPGSAEKPLGEIVNEVTEKATLLVHEEIELAKAEITQKVTRIAKGAALATVGGIFLVFMLIYFLHALALFLDDILNVNPSGVWIGYPIVTGALRAARRDRDPASRSGCSSAARLPPPSWRSPRPRRRARCSRRRAAHDHDRRAHPRRSGARCRPRERAQPTRSTTCRARCASSPTGAASCREPAHRGISAAVAGFLIGGGIAATFSLFRRGR